MNDDLIAAALAITGMLIMLIDLQRPQRGWRLTILVSAIFAALCAKNATDGSSVLATLDGFVSGLLFCSALTIIERLSQDRKTTGVMVEVES